MFKMRWTKFLLYIVIAITVYIVVADALDYNYFTQPVSIPNNHLQVTQHFNILFYCLSGLLLSQSVWCY
jgi:H+/Cl- antiporter ClcA